MNYIEKMSGAVDMDECPYRRTNTARLTVRIMCKCGPCAVCGYPKHTAIHGPVNSGGPGSRPFGHMFVPVAPPIYKERKK